MEGYEFYLCNGNDIVKGIKREDKTTIYYTEKPQICESCKIFNNTKNGVLGSYIVMYEPKAIFFFGFCGEGCRTYWNAMTQGIRLNYAKNRLELFKKQPPRERLIAHVQDPYDSFILGEHVR